MYKQNYTFLRSIYLLVKECTPAEWYLLFWCFLDREHIQALGCNPCLKPLFKQFIHYLYTSAKVSKNNLVKALDLFQKALGWGDLFLKHLSWKNSFPQEIKQLRMSNFDLNCSQRSEVTPSCQFPSVFSCNCEPQIAKHTKPQT